MKLYERLNKSILRRLLKDYTFKYQTIEEDEGLYYYISDGTAVYRLHSMNLLINPKRMENKADDLIQDVMRINNLVKMKNAGCNSIDLGKVNNYIYIEPNEKYEIQLQWDFLSLFEGYDFVAYDEYNNLCVIFREEEVMGYLRPVMKVKYGADEETEKGYAAEVEPLQIEAPESRVEVYGK